MFSLYHACTIWNVTDKDLSLSTLIRRDLAFGPVHMFCWLRFGDVIFLVAAAVRYDRRLSSILFRVPVICWIISVSLSSPVPTIVLATRASLLGDFAFMSGASLFMCVQRLFSFELLHASDISF